MDGMSKDQTIPDINRAGPMVYIETCTSFMYPYAWKEILPSPMLNNKRGGGCLTSHKDKVAIPRPW